MNKATWSWTGFICVLLTLFLGGGWAASVVLVALNGWGHELPEMVIQAQQALGQTLAGGLVGFLGAHAVERNKRTREETRTPVETRTIDTLEGEGQ